MNVTCSAIRDDMIGGVVACLERGFPRRSKSYWASSLQRMSRLPAIEGYPRLGYALEASGQVVGVILLLFSGRRYADREYVRCNISSFCADAAYRSSAILLHMAAVKHKEVTYFNISPASHTLSFIEALGFRRISDGQVLLVPSLSALQPDVRVSVFGADDAASARLNENERRILADHAALGCIALVCATGDAVFPFVFQRRKILRDLILCAQLIYCRNMEEMVRFAGSLGRVLLLRCGPFLIVDANGPIPGLVGRYFPEQSPKYFKGHISPYIGDLAYTELAFFGA